MRIAQTNPDAPWDTDPIRGRIAHDCIHVNGYPNCMGAAAHGGSPGCTCNFLTPRQNDEAEQQAWAAHTKRRGAPCAGCFFRTRDPDFEHQKRELAASKTPVYCHHGMPVFGCEGVPQRDSFAPRAALAYPVCSGWLRAQKIAGIKPPALPLEVVR